MNGGVPKPILQMISAAPAGTNRGGVHEKNQKFRVQAFVRLVAAGANIGFSLGSEL
jgi:hypothetical protein